MLGMWESDQRYSQMSDSGNEVDDMLRWETLEKECVGPVEKGKVRSVLSVLNFGRP
jgi:hypothetical protein